ncbi:SDR family oxidoreductase [Micromonospora endolithica]|uniref:NmrA family transcriptional regulator n=1 Tax=Micromonospora endolithica TaxID=230091 RepID=A0A3A9ZHG2_9ACTN|nr:NmrA family NAD(P)-binding protein [Micromonospora endolithica]RKN47952.1 NmrA family transcriptional regulator [Micromonospora endolithica]
MTDNAVPTSPVLVLGATGRTGRRVAERLTARGLPVRAGSRSAPVPFDWNDRDTWAPVVDGAGAAYLCYQPDLGFPGAADTVGAFAKLAVSHGVSRLVLLSGRGEPGAYAGEEAVRAAGAACTVVRASWFHQNFSENFLVDPVRAGRIVLPAGDAAEPFVDADDIADVVVAALTGDGHAGEVYELTGPRLLTFHEVAAEISRATGREVRYEPVTAARYAAVLREHDLPAEFVDLFGTILDGRNAHLADGIRRALGREGRDFRDYARDTAAAGVWN